MRGSKRAGVSCLLGAISVLAFAPIHFWPVLFVSFGGLVWLLDGCHASHHTLKDRLKCAGLTGFCFGFGFFLTGLYWVAEAFLVEPWRHGWLIPFVMTALPGGMALFFAGAAALAMWMWRRGPARIFALALAFGLAEFARGHILTGFPWNLIGYGLLVDGPLMQLASVFGVYSLSLLAVVLFASPAGIWQPGGMRSPGTIVLAGLCLALLGAGYVGGDMRLANATDNATNPRLRIVQANVDQKDKWRPQNSAAIFTNYLDLTKAEGLEDNDIVIWPETALPFLLNDSLDALKAIGETLPQDTVLLVGAVRVVDQPEVGPRFFNSLLVVGSDGKILGGYDKIHLVPFGEYLPFQDFLESLGVMQMTGVRGGFSEGTGPRLIQVPGAPPAMPLICYEIIFPHEVSDGSAASRWMLNVTNDAWFGRSAGPYQHFHQARVRAVEQGLPLVRAANTGISAVIDPWGRVLAQIGLGDMGSIDAALSKSAPKTIYTVLGTRIEFLGFALVILAWLACGRAGGVRS